jgi:hypothetical protein
VAYSKGWFVRKAFSEIGMAAYVFDLQSQQLQEALERLDSQMATWDGNGIRVGWSIPESEDESSLEDEVDVPYQAREAIFKQLALKIAPLFGKTCSPELKSAASQAMDALLQFTAWPIPMQYPGTLPSGAGNKPWRNQGTPFLGPPVNPVLAGGDGPIDFGTLPTNNGGEA